MSDTMHAGLAVCERHDWKETVKGKKWRNCPECGAIGEFDPDMELADDPYLDHIRELRCRCGRVAKFYGNDGKPVCSEHTST